MGFTPSRSSTPTAALIEVKGEACISRKNSPATMRFWAAETEYMEAIMLRQLRMLIARCRTFMGMV